MVNHGSGYNDAEYYKDPFGIVHLRGLIKDGTTTIDTVIATLPLKYRPENRELIDTISNGSLCNPFSMKYR